MEDRMNELISLGERVIEKVKGLGVDDAELYLAWGETTNIRLITNYITARSGTEVGVGVRVAIGKKVGFSSISSIDEESIVNTARMAVKIARVKKEDPNFTHLPDPVGGFSAKAVFDDNTHMLDMGALSLSIQSIVGGIRRDIPGVRKIDFFIIKGSYAFAVVNSRGISTGDYGTVFLSWIELDIKKNGNIGKGSNLYISRSYREDKFLEFPKTAITMAREGLEARRMKEVFEGDAVIDPIALDSIIWPLSYNVSALNVQEGRSRFIGMLDKDVASENLTIYDDGTLKEGLATHRCDDEGIPMYKKTLVERGVLKTYLYDTYTAYRENRQSTGNARRRDYKSQPRPGTTNLVMEPTTNRNIDDLVGEIDRGVLLRGEIMGSHLIDPIKGTMAVTCLNALYIEDGEIKYPLKAVAMSDNYFDFLRKIDIVGGETRITPNGRLAPIVVRKVHFS